MPVNKDVEKIQKETQAKIKKYGMRTIWSTSKKDCIAKLKKVDEESAKELEGVFNKDLGPQIDKYYKELDKFPDVDLTKVIKHVTKIKSIIDAYQKGIAKNASLGSIGLTMLLDGFMDAIQADVAEYSKFLAALAKAQAKKS